MFRSGLSPGEAAGHPDVLSFSIFTEWRVRLTAESIAGSVRAGLLHSKGLCPSQRIKESHRTDGAKNDGFNKIKSNDDPLHPALKPRRRLDTARHVDGVQFAGDPESKVNSCEQPDRYFPA